MSESRGSDLFRQFAESGAGEEIAHALRGAGDAELADRYRAAWDRAMAAIGALKALNDAGDAGDVSEAARDAMNEAIEELDRLDAEADALLATKRGE